jgi:hypothetical protein
MSTGKEESGQLRSQEGRGERRTVLVDTSGGADDLALVLLEVNDRTTAQAENGEARNVLRSGRIVRGEGRDVLDVDFRFELGPRVLYEGMSAPKEIEKREENGPHRLC